MNEIFIINSSRIQLTGSHQFFPSLFFTIKSETYLLTRAQRNHTVEKHIFFTYQQKDYYSTFLKHINQPYCGKLCEVLQALNEPVKSTLFQEWLMIYKVHQFNPSQKQLYRVHQPVYGEKVKLGSNQKGQISNLFKYDGQLIYLISCQQKNLSQIQFDCITSIQKSAKLVYGVCLNIGQLSICFPFQSIFSQLGPKLTIAKEVLPYLLNTCYISYKTIKFCTGIRVNENIVISTGHLIPIPERRTGAIVKIRFYPYEQQVVGIVTKVGIQGLDYIQIDTKFQTTQVKYPNSLFNKEPKIKQIGELKRVSRLLTYTNNLNENLSNVNAKRKYSKKNNSQKISYPVEQYLNATLNQNRLPDARYQNLQHFFKYDFDKRLKYLTAGTQITDIGFGKLPFSQHLFTKLQIVLPTAVSGNISKILRIQQENVFIKTGIPLFVGSSGSGLWSGDCLQGMVLFLFKVSGLDSSLQQHNFSYCSDFLRKLYLKQDTIIFKDINDIYQGQQDSEIGYVKSKISQQLFHVDQVYNRTKLNFNVQTLKPRL